MTMKQLLVFLAFFVIHTLAVVSSANAQWVLPANEPNNSYINALAIIGTNLFTGSSSGVFRSTDSGESWTSASNGLAYTVIGLPDTDVEALAVIGPNSSSPILFAGGDGGVFRSTDSGTNWTAVNNGLTNKIVDCFAVIGANLFVATFDGKIYHSIDNGTNWTAVYTVTIKNVQEIILAASGTNLFVGADSSLFLSTNNGASWTDETIGLIGPYNFMESLAVSGSSLLAGTDSGGVFRSTDNGTSWTASSNGLKNTIGDDALAVNGSNLFITTDVGVYLSTDEGTNWKSVNAGFGIDSNYGFYAFAMNETYLFVAEPGIGVWRRPLSEMIAPSSVVQSPNVMQSRAQAYPNPFPAKTTITISPTESGIATITIVNLLGQEVEHLFDGELTAGEHSFPWDASGVTPGSYWCIVRRGDKLERIALSVQR